MDIIGCNLMSVKDFRKTPIYSHLKLRFPFLSDQKLLEDVLIEASKNRRHEICYFMEDYISRELAGAVNVLRTNEMRVSGFYAMRFENMVNVTSIKIKSYLYGFILYEIKVPNDVNNINIPLAFDFEEGKSFPDKIILHTRDFTPYNTVSYIPVSSKDDINIELNFEGRAELKLSAVFTCGLWKKDYKFFVNGKEFYCDRGIYVEKYYDGVRNINCSCTIS